MKKILFTLFLSCGLGIHASVFSAGMLNYECDDPEADECEVVGPISEADLAGVRLEIPATVEYSGRVLKVTSIAADAFSGTDISAVSLPSGMRRLGGWAFSECRRLKEIALPEGLEEVSDFCFQDNISLSSVTLPASVASVGKGLFRGCGELKSVTVLSPIEVLPDFMFSDCFLLETVSFTSPVREVGEYCFDNCVALRSFDFTDVSRVGERCFSGCKSLEEVILKSDLSEVPEGAFEHCEAMRLLVLGPQIVSVGDLSFGGCVSLREVEIGRSVGLIGSGAFANCSGLRDIFVVNESAPAITVTTFPRKAYSSATLYVGKGAEMRFAQSPYWDNFENIVGIDTFPLKVSAMTDERISVILDRDILILKGSGHAVIYSADGKMIFNGQVEGLMHIGMDNYSRPLIVVTEDATVKVM